jgi:hypothetical protein
MPEGSAEKMQMLIGLDHDLLIYFHFQGWA